MTDDTMLPFSFPAIHAKKVTVCLRWRSPDLERGVMLLAMAERRLGLADNLARVFPDHRAHQSLDSRKGRDPRERPRPVKVNIRFQLPFAF
jgi:hypothetical protein